MTGSAEAGSSTVTSRSLASPRKSSPVLGALGIAVEAPGAQVPDVVDRLEADRVDLALVPLAARRDVVDAEALAVRDGCRDGLAQRIGGARLHRDGRDLA